MEIKTFYAEFSIKKSRHVFQIPIVSPVLDILDTELALVICYLFQIVSSPYTCDHNHQY